MVLAPVVTWTLPLLLGIIWTIVRIQQNKKYGWGDSHEVGTSVPPPDSPVGGVWVKNDECDPAYVVGGLFAFSTLAGCVYGVIFGVIVAAYGVIVAGVIVGVIVIISFCSRCCGRIRPKTVYKVNGATYYPNGVLKEGTGRDVELGKAGLDDDAAQKTKSSSQEQHLSASA